MRFLRRNKKSKREILVISDLHLSAGVFIRGRKNPLEDFHSDQELVSFLDYFSTNEYFNKEIELIINGDFLDLLAVPYIQYFDDEFWSEQASLEKLIMIIQAHPEVFQALNRFLKSKNKKITYIIGNHDSELVFDSLKERFKQEFDENLRPLIKISNQIEYYEPTPGVIIQHGHQYEIAHQFDQNDSIIETSNGKKYFKPSWGSYYVTHIVNKYKVERSHVNEVKPIKNFLIHSFIHDTFFITRFLIANAYYFFMVRFLHYYRLNLGWKTILKDSLNELSLFEDYEKLTRDFFQQNKEVKVLVVGHTHKATYREYSDGTLFINTGTWVRTVNLDLARKYSETQRTFCHIKVLDDYRVAEFDEKVEVSLNRWSPPQKLPYCEYLSSN